MTDRKDIVLDNEGDLVIRDGDFVVDASDIQHVALIVRLRKGNIKQWPLMGVGEERLINGPIDGLIRREIQLQLQADGYRPRTIEFSELGGVKIEL
jgi:hypothetical protein